MMVLPMYLVIQLISLRKSKIQKNLKSMYLFWKVKFLKISVKFLKIFKL